MTPIIYFTVVIVTQNMSIDNASLSLTNSSVDLHINQ